MEISPQLVAVFESEKEKISQLELTYKNGGMVMGTIKKLRLSPLRLVIQKSAPEKGERPRHKVVFDHVTALKIFFLDGSEKVFPSAPRADIAPPQA